MYVHVSIDIPVDALKLVVAHTESLARAESHGHTLNTELYNWYNRLRSLLQHCPEEPELDFLG